MRILFNLITMAEVEEFTPITGMPRHSPSKDPQFIRRAKAIIIARILANINMHIVKSCFVDFFNSNK